MLRKLYNSGFEEVARYICPACRRGVDLTFRPETLEWQHNDDSRKGSGIWQMSVYLCRANDFRNSRLAPRKK